MQSPIERRRFLAIGSVALTGCAAGGLWLWSSEEDGEGNSGPVRVVTGGYPSAIATVAVPPIQPAAQTTPGDLDLFDQATESRSARLVETDALNSQRRMQERRQQRAIQPAADAAVPADDLPANAVTPWAP